MADCVHNCDETGVSLDPKKDNVLAPVPKHVYSQQSDHITVNCCICANGDSLPPMIIYEKSFPSGAYVKGGVANILYAKSPNGYMDTELYLDWFNLSMRTRKVQDGYGSHIIPELIDVVMENQIEIISLLPHTTHVLQPLDKVLYSPLKKAYSSTVTSLCSTGRDFIVSKNDFSRIFVHLWSKCSSEMLSQRHFGARVSAV